MKNILFSTLLITAFVLSSCSTLKNFLPEPSVLETVTALRKILDNSALKTIAKMSKMKDGGVEALIPEEIRPIFSTMKTLGLGKEIDPIMDAIGKASAIAVDESAAIMKDAIKKVKFKDAAKIVLTGGDAATTVLKEAMYGTVKQRYSSLLNDELQKQDALQYWAPAKSAFNLFAKKKVEGEMSDFLAEKAVDGMFLTMGAEEKDTRKSYKKLGSTVVNKVFDYYTKKK